MSQSPRGQVINASDRFTGKNTGRTEGSGEVKEYKDIHRPSPPAEHPGNIAHRLTTQLRMEWPNLGAHVQVLIEKSLTNKALDQAQAVLLIEALEARQDELELQDVSANRLLEVKDQRYEMLRHLIGAPRRLERQDMLFGQPCDRHMCPAGIELSAFRASKTGLDARTIIMFVYLCIESQLDV
ncbi:MAG: hypothetical protein WC813_04355 [Patescibacteria group bacterium]|jgi:hypothetical protein